MSFLAPLALLLGLFVVLPILAHSLRKGKTNPITFPAAHLVPVRSASAKKRSRLEDPLLLLLRALLVLSLALLAASPLVQCSRLALGRTNGASVSAALIIDDSASMRARLDSGKTRLQEALDAASQLLRTAQPGDAFSIILTGAPARVLTPATTDLSSVRDALKNIAETDRDTDVAGALTLARSMQAESLHKDRPLILLSDLAVRDLDQLDLEGVVVPETGLRGRLRNCALVQAIRGADAVRVEAACTDADALKERFLHLQDEKGEVLGQPVPAQDGSLSLPYSPSNPAEQRDLLVVLSPAKDESLDQIADDDRCSVLDGTAQLTVAVRADQSTAGMKTGAGTVLQAGIEALERGVRVETLSLLPDQVEDFKQFAALFIDDPSGFTPEVRETLERWIRSGGVGVTFLGPSIRRAPLGSGFYPFVTGAPQWERSPSKGTNSKVAGALGPLSTTWSDLGSGHRIALDAQPGGTTLASWDDGKPLVLEQTLGRGLAITVTLPSSVDESDLALRPAFLELLDYAIAESALRKGARATEVGERWIVNPGAQVVGPDGRALERHSTASEGGEPRPYVEPSLSGAYRVVDEQGSSVRYAMRHAAEHIRQSPENVSGRGVTPQGFQLSEVGISREVALFVLILSFVELCVRILRRPRTELISEQNAASRPSPPSSASRQSDLQKVAS